MAATTVPAASQRVSENSRILVVASEKRMK